MLACRGLLSSPVGNDDAAADRDDGADNAGAAGHTAGRAGDTFTLRSTGAG